MSFRPTSKRAAPPARSEFKAGPKAKPGAVAKANRILGKSSDAMPKPKKNPMHRNPKPMGATRQVNKFFSGD